MENFWTVNVLFPVLFHRDDHAQRGGIYNRTVFQGYQIMDFYDPALIVKRTMSHPFTLD